MEFKVEKKSVRVVIGDKKYEVKVPSVSQQKEIQKKISEAGSNESLDVMSEHLVNLGLPLDVVNDLDADTFLELYEFIHMPKKKLQPAT